MVNSCIGKIKNKFNDFMLHLYKMTGENIDYVTEDYSEQLELVTVHNIQITYSDKPTTNYSSGANSHVISLVHKII
jgi:hypothetical protein